MVTTLALATTTYAASGFLKSCSILNGKTCRSMMLQVKYKVEDEKFQNQLKLNTCLGWPADSCGFTYAPSSHFSDIVSYRDNKSISPVATTCTLILTSVTSPHNECDEVYDVIALSNLNVLTPFFLDPAL